MNFALEKNSILCLNEAWEKHKDSKQYADQYLFAFKELSSFVELYCKFLIAKENCNITKDDLKHLKFLHAFYILKYDGKTINYKDALNLRKKKNFEQQIDLMGSNNINQKRVSDFDELEKSIIKINNIRNNLMHLEYQLTQEDIVLFYVIVMKFEEYVGKYFNNSIEKSCEDMGKEDLYNNIMESYRMRAYLLFNKLR